MFRYFFNLAVALDQLANAMLAGHANETLSARAARAQRDGKAWGCVLCRLLEAIHRRHCMFSFRATVIGARDMLQRFSEVGRPERDQGMRVTRIPIGVSHSSPSNEGEKIDTRSIARG